MACFTSHDGNHGCCLLLQTPLSVKAWKNPIPYLNSDRQRMDPGATHWPPWLNQDITGCFSWCFQCACSCHEGKQFQGLPSWYFCWRTTQYIPLHLCDRSQHLSCCREVPALTNYDIHVCPFTSSESLYNDNWDTIHRYFKDPLDFFSSRPFYAFNVKLPTTNTPVSTMITSDPCFCYFNNCVGAIDGIYIQASVPVDEHPNMWNKKGFLSQNCLLVCNFDLIFTYAVMGWDGSTADATMWHEAHSDNLAIPEGKYLLTDAGFSLSGTLLVLYQGIWYHLKEWRQAELQ